MQIQMAGIDFTQAALEQRSLLSFTKGQAQRGMHRALQEPGIAGCVLLSTCNRTELWLCVPDDWHASPAKLLCRLKEQPFRPFAAMITERSGQTAVQHLLETACGMHSRIWGEDQILAQIKESAALAATEKTDGKILARLFQTAIAAAKAVKTQVHLSAGSPSVATATVEACRKFFGSLQGVRCLVIGSGHMGSLAADALRRAGATVCITLRQYKYGISPIPPGCRGVPYDQRLKQVAAADLIVSATASPHCTLTTAAVQEVCQSAAKPRLLIDLAVPRDIEPSVADLPDCTLRTIDDIPCEIRQEERQLAELRSRQILQTYQEKFQKQLLASSTLPAIQSLAQSFTDSLQAELLEALKPAGLSPADTERFAAASRSLLQKHALRALFSLRDQLTDSQQKTS